MLHAVWIRIVACISRTRLKKLEQGRFALTTLLVTYWEATDLKSTRVGPKKQKFYHFTDGVQQHACKYSTHTFIFHNLREN